MKKIHNKQGKRIQNGEPFDFMLEQLLKKKNEGKMNKLNITDVSRWAIVFLWKKSGNTTIPQKALDLLKYPIEDLEL